MRADLSSIILFRNNFVYVYDEVVLSLPASYSGLLQTLATNTNSSELVLLLLLILICIHCSIFSVSRYSFASVAAETHIIEACLKPQGLSTFQIAHIEVSSMLPGAQQCPPLLLSIYPLFPADVLLLPHSIR